MKKTIFLAALFVFLSLSLSAQTSNDSANTYFKKAENSLEQIDYEGAKKYFDQGLNILGTITENDIEAAQQGVYIYYELKYYKKAQEFAKQYLSLSKQTSSESHIQMAELYNVTKKKIRKEEELKKIESLKKDWMTMQDKFTLNVDSILEFNQKGIAIYKNNGFYGVIDDKGNIIVEADTFTSQRNNGDIFILLDNEKKPKKIYCYNSILKKSTELLQPSKYNKRLTSFGNVTIPRGNRELVMYPSEISETLVYDFKGEKLITINEVKSFCKRLKKDGKIDKYDAKKRIIKIGKDSYLLGNKIGGKVYSLYSVKKKTLYGYLFANKKKSKIIKKSQLGYLSNYYDDTFVSIDTNGQNFYYNNDGKRISKPTSNTKYKGGTRVVKVKNGYHLVDNEGNVFLKNKKLEKLKDFLKKNR